MDSASFTIARDAAGFAGYDLGILVVGGNVITLVVGIDDTGGAHDAGMSDVHVGWKVVEVDGRRSEGIGDARRLIDRTKAPYNVFSITVKRWIPEECDAALRAMIPNLVQGMYRSS